MNTKTKQVLSCALLCVLLAACDSKEEKHQKYLDRGNKLYEAGDFDKAMVEYKNAARIKPSDAEVRYRMGMVEEARGDVKNAFGDFLGAEQQDANHRLAEVKLAQYLLAAEQYEESQKRINTVLKIDPTDADGHALQAALFLRQKDFEKTESSARRSLEKDPKNIIAYTVLTGLWVAKGEQEKAGAMVEEALVKNPKSLPLLLLKAMVYERSSNLNKISEAYKIIFSLKPTEVRFRDDLAKVYLQAEQKDDAEKVLREGVNSAPDSWDMKKRLVSFLNEARGIDAAEQQIKDFIKAYPENGELYLWLADLYIANKATDRAIALLEQVIQKGKEQAGDASSLNAKTSLARIHFAAGDKQLAERLSSAVLDTTPNNKEALFVRAQLLFEKGDHQEAIAVLRTIVRDNPKATDALHVLAETLLLQGYVDLAIDTLTQLNDADPSNFAAKVRLAQLYALQGDPAKAQKLLAFVTKLSPDYPVGWESTARVAITTKDWGKALEAAERLEKIQGQEMTALYLRGQIASGQGRSDEAFSDYAKVIAANPSSPLAQHALRSYAEAALQGKKPEAIAAFIKEQNIETPFAYTLVGDSAIAMNKMQEASAAYEKAIAAGAKEPEPFLALARLFIAEKKYNDALGLLDKASQASPAEVRPLLMKAEILMSLSKNEEAVGVYDALLKKNPALDVAANNMAQLIADHMYNDKAAMEKARLAAERFIRSSSPYYLDTLGWVYFRLGENQQAQTILERVLAFGEKLPLAVNYHYGAILAKAGQSEAAKEQLSKAVVDGQSYPGIEDAKRILKGL